MVRNSWKRQEGKFRIPCQACQWDSERWTPRKAGRNFNQIKNPSKAGGSEPEPLPHPASFSPSVAADNPYVAS